MDEKLEFEGKEPFKIKFTTVLIIVLMLFAIIGILAYNLRRLEDTLTSLGITKDKIDGMEGMHGIESPNDYEYFSENYQKALKLILENEFNNKELSIVPKGNDLKGVSSITIDDLGDLYLNIDQSSPLYEKYGKMTKIASNVLYFEIVNNTGHDYWPVLYIIHTDGHVSKLTGYTMDKNGAISGELKTESIPGLLNIVKIVVVSYDNANAEMFVDINGNMFNADGTAFE